VQAAVASERLDGALEGQAVRATKLHAIAVPPKSTATRANSVGALQGFDQDCSDGIKVINDFE
jgi:hypothetical protein